MFSRKFGLHFILIIARHVEDFCFFWILLPVWRSFLKVINWKKDTFCHGEWGPISTPYEPKKNTEPRQWKVSFTFFHDAVWSRYCQPVIVRWTVTQIYDGFCQLFCIWAASSEFGTYRLCEQRRFRRACASSQSRMNLRCSLIQAVSQEEPSDRKPDPWSLWKAGHAQLKFVMTECSKT